MIYESSLYHHGIKGQHWGKRNGPPYPLDRKVARQQKRQEHKGNHLNAAENAKKLEKEYNEVKQISASLDKKYNLDSLNSKMYNAEIKVFDLENKADANPIKYSNALKLARKEYESSSKKFYDAGNKHDAELIKISQQRFGNRTAVNDYLYGTGAVADAKKYVDTISKRQVSILLGSTLAITAGAGAISGLIHKIYY